MFDDISAILEPINAGNVKNYLNRFKDDLCIRDNRIKQLENKLSSLLQDESQSKLSKFAE